MMPLAAILGLATAFLQLVNTLINKMSDKHTPDMKRIARKVINPSVETLARWERKRQEKLKRQ